MERFLSDILIADVIPSTSLKKNGKSELNLNLSKQFLYLKYPAMYVAIKKPTR